jgi:hypothetical protein
VYQQDGATREIEMLNDSLTPEVCEKVVATMSPVVHSKILRSFAEALDSGADLLAADGTSPAGERVMARFNADMERQEWTAETRRMVRFNVRVVGLTLIREACEISRH